MKLNKLLSCALFLLMGGTLSAQILSVNPVFPQPNDTVTIIYDATQGNSALTGATTVYAHTGVITNLSATPTSWLYVQGNWGTVDPNVVMTPLGNNRHQIKYHLRNFYGVPQSETITRLAFVFRNADGSVVGREFDGSDIFFDLYPPGQLATTFLSPSNESVIVQSLGNAIQVEGASSSNSTLTLFDNGMQIAQASNATTISHNLVTTTGGTHTVELVADDGNNIVRDTFIYVVNPPLNVQNSPAGTHDGINYTSATSVRLQLYAPDKDYVYVLGDFNNWTPDVNYYMNLSADSTTWWIDIPGLTAGQEYAFQYYVDGLLKVADPYSEVVLDPNNDQWIPSVTYPNLHPYPTGKTTGIATLIFPGKAPYNWQTTNFTPPAKEDLVIYEIHMRDWIARHDYQTLLDSLDYLQNLGINALQFMPVTEFEGNDSWGYNPSFHMALDKYYGTPESFKAIVDECHARGIAVIVDAVYNHAFSQSPLCQLYWDAGNFRPAPDNPWLNVSPTHDFNVGYDFNHDSPATQAWMDRTLEYLLEEYKLDGFRFDLSKGFTQNNTLGNVGAWGQYDLSRVNHWKRISDNIWNINSNAYVILEHFSDNSEETDLANYGMMLWGNINHEYNEASMGYSSNLDWISWQQRGWNNPGVVGYMESHDEERLNYKNQQFGNSGPNGYDVTDLNTALARQEMVGALFFTIPGPKMIWQFGELGYDISIDDPCRVCPKPILWNYNSNPQRRRLYKVWAALAKLKTSYSTFSTGNYNLSVGGVAKYITLNDPNMNAIVVGNTDVGDRSVTPTFQHTGWWYEYFTGDSINITANPANFTFTAGEYRLYTDVKLPAPDLSVITDREEGFTANLKNLETWPNPSNDLSHIRYELQKTGEAELALFDLNGQKLGVLVRGFQAKGQHLLTFDGKLKNGQRVGSGVYFLQLTGKDQQETLKIIRLQ